MSFINLNEYLSLLKKANRIICVKDYKKYKSALILRHDVDESMDFAYELYRLENSNNIKSTYYILLTSDLYNPFSAKNKKRIKEMVENGFEVGLHFDPLAYDSENLIENFKKEVEAFEKFLEIKLYSYSMHNPSVSGKYIKYLKLLDAYDDSIFCDECYISDSAFSFRGKDLNEYIEKSNYRLVQLLIHADHLIANGEISYKKPIKKMMNNYLEKIDDMYKVNKIYKTEREALLIEYKC